MSSSKFFGVLLTSILILIMVVCIIMWIWNALMPALVQVPTISFWQAFMLLVLCRLLVGGVSNP
jgi:hypothetical protein